MFAQHAQLKRLHFLDCRQKVWQYHHIDLAVSSAMPLIIQLFDQLTGGVAARLCSLLLEIATGVYCFLQSLQA